MVEVYFLKNTNVQLKSSASVIFTALFCLFSVFFSAKHPDELPEQTPENSTTTQGIFISEGATVYNSGAITFVPESSNKSGKITQKQLSKIIVKKKEPKTALLKKKTKTVKKNPKNRVFYFPRENTSFLSTHLQNSGTGISGNTFPSMNHLLLTDAESFSAPTLLQEKTLNEYKNTFFFGQYSSSCYVRPPPDDFSA